jgi:hypothetical protein
MRSRPENVEPALVLGYLGRDALLYCSRECATRRGQADARPVGRDEHQALADGGALRPSLLCPACGNEYPLDLDDEREP